MEHRIFSAEQIAVPPALPSILKAWTKAIIRANPDDVNAWSAECVVHLVGPPLCRAAPPACALSCAAWSVRLLTVPRLRTLQLVRVHTSPPYSYFKEKLASLDDAKEAAPGGS